MTNHNKKIHEPSVGFLNWWQPDGFNQSTGAQTGGHPEALRKCVRPDTKEIRYYGVDATLAFNTLRYRDEYHAWLRSGQPPRTENSDGTAAHPEQVKACLAQIREILKDSTLASSTPF